MAAKVRSRLYREFLTPVLHRRFTRGAGIALVLCYLEAVLIGEKSSLLWWFPIGRTGLRTLLLCISSLSIFVLRVAQLHQDARVTKSPFETFQQYLFRFNTVQTLTWYLFSAWWFSEVYFWSASDGANLGWISQGRSWETKRLNERPIYLRSVFFMFAILQTAIHLFYDYDRVFLPIRKKLGSTTEQRPLLATSPIAQLKTNAPLVLQRVVVRVGVLGVLSPFLYAIFIRKVAWNWTYAFASMMWDIPFAEELSYIPPYHISLILRAMSSSLLLALIWESSSMIFTAYVAQEPLTKGVPLTDESPDPNGILINGLKSHKNVVKAFAFWELVHISQRFESRRKSIFVDIDRPSGPVWFQILSVSLNLIEGVTTRIAEFQKPPQNPLIPQPQRNLQTLPRLSAPLRQDQVLRTPPPPSTRLQRIESNMGKIAKSYGQSPPSSSSGSPLGPLGPLSPRAKQYLALARKKLLTQDQRESISPTHITSLFTDYLLRFIRSPVGIPFRQTFRRRVCAVVLGSPHSAFDQIVDAIGILSRLAVASLQEDDFGRVSKDVPTLIRTFAATISTLETFVAGMSVHWTDVTFKDRRVEEVDILVAALREGLRTMLVAFEQFSAELEIGEREMREAKRLAEMEA